MATLVRACGPTLAIVAVGAAIGLASSFSIATEAFAAKNFAVKCEKLNGLNGSLKSLAISPIAANQLCTCGQSNRELRRQLNAAGVRCFETKITNFNQPTGANGGNGGNGGPPGDDGLGNPGNAKPVGKAGEGPPRGSQNARMNAPAVGGPGTKGASDGI